MGVRLSMGSVGNAYDNAMAESFFASLECKLIDRRRRKSFAEARMANFSWTEGWGNPRRRHKGPGQKSPINFETTLHDQSTANRQPAARPTSAGELKIQSVRVREIWASPTSRAVTMARSSPARHVTLG